MKKGSNTKHVRPYSIGLNWSRALSYNDNNIAFLVICMNINSFVSYTVRDEPDVLCLYVLKPISIRNKRYLSLSNTHTHTNIHPTGR